MHYLVDAYNLMFLALRKRGSLQQRRQMMIGELNDAISRLNLHVTLVFDGAEVHLPHPSRGHYEQLELVYTPKSITADEYITQEVASSKTPACITVVTNDRELWKRCQNFRAKTLTIEEFLTFIAKKKDRKKKQSRTSGETFRESSAEFKRLLEIFEQKLLDEDS